MGPQKIYRTPGNFIQFEDGPNFDAFGRLRISEISSLFDTVNIYNDNSVLWDQLLVGGGASAYHPNQALIDMSVGTAAGDRVVRQSRRYFSYEAGKSMFIKLTGVMGEPKANVAQRVGYFDDNNGLLFDQNGIDLSVVVRTKTSGSVVDNRVSQSDWNVDKMNGDGPSGINLEMIKTQIFLIDFQYLGVGRVRYGFTVGGIPVYCHLQNHTNVLDVPYMSTPSLPVRYELINLAESASPTEMKQICSNVSVEGASLPKVMEFGVDRDASVKSLGTTFVPIISLRLKAELNRKAVQFNHFYIKPTSVDNVLYRLVRRPTSLTDAVWNSADPNSAVEFDIAATAYSGDGHVVTVGATSDKVDFSGTTDKEKELFITSDIAGTSDIITLVGRALLGTANVLAGFNVSEQIT